MAAPFIKLISEHACMLGSVERALAWQEISSFWRLMKGRKRKTHCNWHGGRFFVRRRLEEWQRISFPFWSYDQVQQILTELCDPPYQLELIERQRLGGLHRDWWYTPRFDRFKEMQRTFRQTNYNI